jgi:hypothetical protein
MLELCLFRFRVKYFIVFSIDPLMSWKDCLDINIELFSEDAISSYTHNNPTHSA